MTIQLMFSALNHLSNEELSRLSTLWRVQASSGEIEAKEIARAFADTLQTRLNVQQTDISKTLAANEKMVTASKLKKMFRIINRVLRLS